MHLRSILAFATIFSRYGFRRTSQKDAGKRIAAHLGAEQMRAFVDHMESKRVWKSLRAESMAKSVN